MTFTLAEEGMFFNNTVYFITGEEDELKYLTVFLNSSLIDWYYRTLSVQLGEKAVRLFSIYVEKIPIIKTNQQNDILTLSDEIISNFKNLKDREAALDNLVYKLYNLTVEEIEFIDAL